MNAEPPAEDTASRVAIKNDLTVTVKGDTHTLLNLLRWAAAANWAGPTVEFCGYAIPHPSVDEACITVQYENEAEQSSAAVIQTLSASLEALEQCCDRLSTLLE